jgi:hypothetical protein
VSGVLVLVLVLVCSLSAHGTFCPKRPSFFSFSTGS